MKVLFLCPHAAAKSVVAAAMLLNESTRMGRSEVEVRNAGTEPDENVNPMAAELLDSLGLPIPNAPRLVTSEDIRWADVVVSLGCHRADLPDQPRRWDDWSDAPGVTEDSSGFVDLISERITTLLR